MKGKIIVSSILSAMVGAAAGAASVTNTVGKRTNEYKQLADKHLALLVLMNDWMKTKQEGKSIELYFQKNNYKSVAIYGLSYVGERLLDELKDSNIEVKYAIDRNAESMYSEVDVYLPGDILPEVDVIVVTAISFFDNIYDILVDKVKCPIVSMEDVLYEISCLE